MGRRHSRMQPCPGQPGRAGKWPRSIRSEQKRLTPAQRTLFRAMKLRFGERLGLKRQRSRCTRCGGCSCRRTTRLGRPSCARATVSISSRSWARVRSRRPAPTSGGRGPIILQMVGDGHAFGLPSLAHPAEVRRFGAVAHSQSLVGLLTPGSARRISSIGSTPRIASRLLTYGWNANIGLLLEKRRAALVAGRGSDLVRARAIGSPLSQSQR